MITYRNKNSWQRPLVAALIGSVAVGLGVWWWSGQSESTATTPVTPSASGVDQAQSTTPTLVAPTTTASAPTILSDGRPSDVAPSVWSALSKAIANKPHLKPEVDKVVSYMRFQRSFEYWQTLEGTRDVQQRRQLGQSMLEEMPGRLSQGEFTMGEAQMMVAALMSDLEPDEKKREQIIEDWNRKLAQAAPQPTEDAQLMEIQKRVEDRRIVPGLLTEGPTPEQVKLEQALEERTRLR